MEWILRNEVDVGAAQAFFSLSLHNQARVIGQGMVLTPTVRNPSAILLSRCLQYCPEGIGDIPRKVKEFVKEVLSSRRLPPMHAWVTSTGPARSNMTPSRFVQRQQPSVSSTAPACSYLAKFLLPPRQPGKFSTAPALDNIAEDDKTMEPPRKRSKVSPSSAPELDSIAEEYKVIEPHQNPAKGLVQRVSPAVQQPVSQHAAKVRPRPSSTLAQSEVFGDDVSFCQKQTVKPKANARPASRGAPEQSKTYAKATGVSQPPKHFFTAQSSVIKSHRQVFGIRQPDESKQIYNV